MRGGHREDPRPYEVDTWLQSGFCSLRRDGKKVQCSGKYKQLEDQLFRSADVSKQPWSGESGRNAPPSYEISTASSSSSASRSSQGSSINPPKYETGSEHDRRDTDESKKR